MAGSLVLVNTDQSPEVHWGAEFAAEVALGEIELRYV
jgi:hypothetical protein